MFFFNVYHFLLFCSHYSPLDFIYRPVDGLIQWCCTTSNGTKQWKCVLAYFPQLCSNNTSKWHTEVTSSSFCLTLQVLLRYTFCYKESIIKKWMLATTNSTVIPRHALHSSASVWIPASTHWACLLCLSEGGLVTSSTQSVHLLSQDPSPTPLPTWVCVCPVCVFVCDWMIVCI